MFFTPGYMKCPTGRFKLNGTVPQYLAEMLFADEFSAKIALAEAQEVLTNGKQGCGVFASLYIEGTRLVAAADLHSAWAKELDEIQVPA